MQFNLNGHKLVILVLSLSFNFSLRLYLSEPDKSNNSNNFLDSPLQSEPVGITPPDNFLNSQDSNPTSELEEKNQVNNFSTFPETKSAVEALKVKNATESSPANSLGQHLIDSQILEPPYKLKRCDQVVLVKGQRFIDYNDYGNRKPTFYEIGIYVVNIFEGESTDNLIDSLDQAGISKMPKFLRGTGTCLDLYSASSGKRYPICLQNTDVMKQIRQVFEDFLKCRNGDDLQGGLIKRCQEKNHNDILPSLDTKGVNLNSESLINQLKNQKNENINPYYSDKVPGS
jgi:hypothetical protein